MKRRRLLNLLTMAMVLGSFLAAGPAMADSTTSGGDIFSSVNAKASDLFKNVRNLLMVLGAFGVLGLAAGAFFGRFKWHWAISLLGGLALVAFVSQILSYFGLTAPATN